MNPIHKEALKFPIRLYSISYHRRVVSIIRCSVTKQNFKVDNKHTEATYAELAKTLILFFISSFHSFLFRWPNFTAHESMTLIRLHIITVPISTQFHNIAKYLRLKALMGMRNVPTANTYPHIGCHFH